MPSSKSKFFKEFFVPLYESKQSPDTDDNGNQEDTIAITTRELCQYYNSKTGKTISTNNLKQTYLNEFISNGWIDEQDSKLDKKQHLYYPLVDFVTRDGDGDKEEQPSSQPLTELSEKIKIKKLSSQDTMVNILQYPILPVPVSRDFSRMFSMLSAPPQSFIRFLEWYLSDGKCDPSHNSTVSFGNCMIRIPGSFNSKCFQNDDRSIEESQVKLIQKWNGFLPKLPIELLNDFKGYLADLKISKLETEQQKTQLYKPQYSVHCNIQMYNCRISWIENLLQKAIPDYRKYVIRTIIAPYLITVKGLDYNQSFGIIRDWLYSKCATLQRLNSPNSVFEYKIKEALNYSLNKNWRPISLDKLRYEKPELYSMIMTA